MMKIIGSLENRIINKTKSTEEKFYRCFLKIIQGDLNMYIICLLISFGACIIGAICGIGGGVIIKPVLDSLGILDVYSISFLSGSTVLGMTYYSVAHSKINGNSRIKIKIGSLLSMGAIVGGIVGKELFNQICHVFKNQDMVNVVQAVFLMIITLWTLICTIKKEEIRVYPVSNPILIIIIGAMLGVLSAFLGIGGGPINLIVLFIFFSMDTKTAAENSLYIILFSQGASILKTVLERDIPELSIILLIGMIVSGVIGGVVGRRINKQINEYKVNRLFKCIMCVIIVMNIYNIFKYLT